jgi:hypothetical protein
MSEPPQQPSATPHLRADGGETFPWYDAYWLAAYERAKAILAVARPGMLGDFVRAFDVFRTRPDFRPVLFERLFDEGTLTEIRRVAATLARGQLELHEASQFRRFVVHDHAFFSELQAQLLPLVSEAAGEALECSYNFLSLYAASGVCPPHLDAPEAKWTLDFCIDQSAAWPIYFSRPLPWPTAGEEPWTGRADWAQAIKQDAASEFTGHSLLPGQAILFSGSSQWHYRDVMPRAPGRQFCDLLFFHFIPRGTAELAKPANWARLFGVAELEQVTA